MSTVWSMSIITEQKETIKDRIRQLLFVLYEILITVWCPEENIWATKFITIFWQDILIFIVGKEGINIIIINQKIKIWQNNLWHLLRKYYSPTTLIAYQYYYKRHFVIKSYRWNERDLLLKQESLTKIIVFVKIA